MKSKDGHTHNEENTSNSYHLGILVCLLSLSILVPGATSGGNVHEIFVAPGGRDYDIGDYERPVATLAGARNLIRELKVRNSISFSFLVVSPHKK
jgi:hypothetical protein